MEQKQAVILGIDLGAKSVGWSVLAASCDDAGRWEPNGLLDAGARCFDAGVDGNLEQGKDEARAVARRMQRGARRQLYRRAQRLRCTLRVLNECGLLPDAVTSPPDARHVYLSSLDQRLKSVMLADREPAGPVQDAPIYQLRRRCLSGHRTLEEIGRALFHLAQRRGFKSNRKDTSKDDDKGAVKSGIAELGKLIAASGMKTLGAYFSTLNPHEKRIRNRWAARSMYETEFNEIWNAQAPFHPSVMTDDAKAKIHHAIFHQRKLKSSADLIGFCELEPQQRRAPMGCLIFQRFRIVQKINDLTWRDENAVLCGPLSVEDPRRTALIDRLDTEGDLSMAEARKTLGLHKKAAFMLEEGAAKTLPGNRTVAKLTKSKLASYWQKWTPAQRELFVNELISDVDQDVWRKRLGEFWALPDDVADDIADLGLQSGYGSLSRRAMRRLLVEMEAGVPFATAKKKLYGDLAKGRPALEKLPGVLRPETRKFLGKLNNPAVARSLTELRKVVNAVIRNYGKPVRIRIELARDIRNTRKQRQDITKKIKERTGEREGFRKDMAAALPRFEGRDPSRNDIEKWALAEECTWTCPYTGKTITPELLFGANAQFDIEHIIPRSRRPDDSFINKTLCHNDANRAKGNQTPFEAFHGTDEWEKILGRVKRFQGSGARAKLRLFEIETIDDDFTNRDLNDTRYASRLARDYLGMLYGAANGIDESGNQCVQACCGQITSTLRYELGLLNILSDDGTKNREDHRHHAVDAVVIALAGPRAVQALATAAGNAPAVGRRRYAPLSEPWPGFRANVQSIIDEIVVSHRLDQTLSGALHEGTNFSPAKTHINGKTGKTEEVRHVRKKLIGITPGQIENIVDPQVKKAVVEFLDGRDPKAVFKDGNPFPTLPNRNAPGRPIPIRRVRVWEKNNVISVGSGGAARHVAPGENNHLEIVASTDKKGNEIWDISNIVSRFEASRRLRNGDAVVNRSWGEGKELVMVLRRGDYLELEISGARQLMRVTSIGCEWIQMQPPSFAAPVMEKADRNAWLFQSGKRLQAASPRKVSVSPIGEVFPCNE